MNLTNELTRITRFLCVAGALTSAAPVFAHVVDGPATPVMQQNEFEVKGTVVDEIGTPVIGANVIEKGNHTELMHRHGFYYDLYTSQFR